MLRITQHKDPKYSFDYLSESLTVDDYYSQKGEVRSHWSGNTSIRLGLKGKRVSKKDYGNLIRNRHPVTGEALTPKSGAHRRCAYELCFNANKSTSIAVMMVDKRVADAHRKAVAFAMKAVEEDVHIQHTDKGRNTLRKTGNLIWAEFTHTTSRPIEKEGEMVPDPHLHSHVIIPQLLMILTNRYRALEMGPVHKVATYYENLYHSKLAEEVQKLGFEVERSANGWEISGISKAMRDKFSGRTLEIEKLAKEKEY